MLRNHSALVHEISNVCPMHPVRTCGAHTPVVQAIDLIDLIVDGDDESTWEYPAEVLVFSNIGLSWFMIFINHVLIHQDPLSIWTTNQCPCSNTTCNYRYWALFSFFFFCWRNGSWTNRNHTWTKSMNREILESWNNLQLEMTNFHMRVQRWPKAPANLNQRCSELSPHHFLYLLGGSESSVTKCYMDNHEQFKTWRTIRRISLTDFDWYGILNMKCSIVIAFSKCPPTFIIAWDIITVRYITWVLWQTQCCICCNWLNWTIEELTTNVKERKA